MNLYEAILTSVSKISPKGLPTKKSLDKTSSGKHLGSIYFEEVRPTLYRNS